MLILDSAATVQPLPIAPYVDVCVVEDNPWRKLFQSGTAGATTELFCVERLINGAPYQFLRLEGRAHSNAVVPHNDIDALIALMSPSMSQLAAAFGVSRQRIYDWRNGAGMSPANLDQMRALLTAARMLSQKSSVPLSQIGARKLSNGKSFWTEIASGTHPVDAAASVAKIIERDESERSALRHSLANHKVARLDDTPMFSPHLSE